MSKLKLSAASFIEALVKPKLSDVEQHGIKGQKWGVRRTDAQLGKTSSSSDSDSGSSRGATTKDAVRTRYKTSSKNLTDAQLLARIKRLENEKKYNELNARTVGAGEKFVKTVIGDAGKTLATKAAVGLGSYAMQKMVGKSLGADAEKFFKPKK